MSNPSNSKKKNKKKKKLLTETNNSQTETKQNGKTEPKASLTINEVLPQQIGMKTTFNDVEVTMTHGGETKVVDSLSNSSKKKKKKKKAKKLAENSEEAKVEETDPQSYIKFNEDSIELVNHPEISVTIANSAVDKEKEPAKTEDENTIVSTLKEEPAAPTVSKTSKKKKKKKKSAQDSNLEQSKTGEVSSSAPTGEVSSTSPTYVKLPGAGDNCVLLVSHESFANNNTVSAPSTETVTVTSNSVLIKRKDLAESKQTCLSPVFQSEQSVSILPVVQDSIARETKANSNINKNCSIQQASNMVKKEDLSAESPVQDITASGQEAVVTKAQLKAERRAKQEAQRAAKLAKGAGKDASNVQAIPAVVKSEVSITPAVKNDPVAKESVEKLPNDNVPAANKSVLKASAQIEVSKKSQIFPHLLQWKDVSLRQLSDTSLKIHPAIVELGFHYGKGNLRGSNARCVGFLAAFSDVIKDYKTPPNKDMAKDLESKLSAYLKFLGSCRPLSVSVLNCVRFLKHQISHLPKETSEEKSKNILCSSIQNFVREEIVLAKEAICNFTSAKIMHGDNILVFAYSSLVKDALCEAHNQKKSFQVIVADSRHNSEGHEMVRQLRQYGLQCAFVPSGSVSIIMKNISKVVIGAHALLSNGSVMSRAGCKEMSLFASYYNVPVLVCCETYKFCERALTDSCVHNELGQPQELIRYSINRSANQKMSDYLSALQVYNILYDVTPSDLISVVITEKGLIPTTSVPVVLRVKHAGWQE